MGGVALFGLLQLVPYGWWHVNPPVTADAPWPDAASAALARQACYDCHSNETDWPFYSYVAPMSWLVRADVQAGRKELNFSEWDEYRDEADDAVEEVSRGAVPPDRYTRLHPDAKLSTDDVATQVAALEAMDEGDGGHGGSGPG